MLVINQEKAEVNISLETPTGSHHYKFTIMSGSGDYTFASGNGKLTISGSHKSPEFTIKMQSMN